MTPEREISFAFIAVRPDRRLRGYAESEATNLPLILRARPKIGVWHIRVLRGAEKAPHGGDQGPSFRARDGCCLEVFGEATGGGRNMRRRARRPSVEALPLSGRTGPNIRVESKAPLTERPVLAQSGRSPSATGVSEVRSSACIGCFNSR